MDIWNNFLNEYKNKKPINMKHNVDKYIKQHEKSYEDIRNSVMETPETKENHIENIISKIAKKKININV